MKKAMTKKNNGISCSHFFVFLLFLFAGKSFAQHSLQLDFAGAYSQIQGSNPGGIYTLPPGGGMLLSSGTAWLCGGNTNPLSNILGTLTGQDLVIKTNNSTRMTIFSGGNISLTNWGSDPAALLSFGQFWGGAGGASIHLYDAGPGGRYGFGIQSSEMQSFIPNLAQFSWNVGGDLQVSPTNQIMLLTSAGQLSVTSLMNIVNQTTALTGYQIAGTTVLHTTGVQNLFVGTQAGASVLPGGSGNTAGGFQALGANTTGYNNTAFGNQALGATVGGFNNVAIGGTAMLFNGAGFFNTAVGTRALWNNTSGSQNVAIGTDVGFSNTTESNNTFIGFKSNGAAGVTNATAIGANSSVTQSNSLILGNGVYVGIGNTAPLTTLSVTGGVSVGVATFASGLGLFNNVYFAGSSDYVILTNATTINAIVRLPPAFDKGQIVTVAKTDATANTVTVLGSGADVVINPLPPLAAKGSTVTLVADGNLSWYIIGSR